MTRPFWPGSQLLEGNYLKPTYLSSPGIYRIDGPSGKFYIGSAKWLSRRWIEHKRDLRRGTHGNPILQAAWSKYGEEKFSLTVLEYIDDVSKLIEREQFWIDQLDAVNAGYNVLPIAGSSLGKAHSEETKMRMSESHKGKKHGPMSEEQKAHYSKLYTGRKLSEETRRKMGDARRGKPRPQHVCDAVSKAQKGKPKSAEHIAKIVMAKTGKKLSEETKQKMRDAHAARRMAYLESLSN